ncbi:nuclear transport factor 2 family protein [Paraburkholderia megapolitana]|uniref:SnoaL-like domain-containing protein n=1 Tax=Paraburkholderia megapolitana TaxID=420953 RepID=A0A1I3SAK9_9BURK|nr:nuclear transport factor 2 family protein [Paraburkholderia megapolitana]QDQ85802.1 hypothetical protein FNZ07_33045 [Paraburkholderia megapolitana]SFJ55430.1 SnoaL-like domain-containing protein [Paraburkholderia megapolitana]
MRLSLPPTPYRVALETYIDAKDNTRPERIDEIFAADAVLTFSLATENIAFPARTVGAPAIAKTLVSDFGAQYARCRTYYVCDSLHVSGTGDATGAHVDALPWLVVMREPATGSLRVGHGVYHWMFARDAAGVRATRLHIHIARMDVVADPDGVALATLQDGLSYPWLRPEELRERILSIAREVPALGFVESFSQPVTMPVASTPK